MRRAAVSIPSNIAKGFSRRTPADNRYFVRAAFGSGAELETQLSLSIKLKFVSEKETASANAHLQEVMKMLNTLSRRLA